MGVFHKPTSIQNRVKTAEELSAENLVLTNEVETLKAENTEIKAQMNALLGVEEAQAV